MPGSNRRRYPVALAVCSLAVFAALAVLPAVASSTQRPARYLRALVFRAELLDDRNVMFQSNSSNPGHVSLMMVLAQRGLAVPKALIEEASRATWGLTVAELAERGLGAGLPSKVLHVPVDCVRRALDTVPLPAVTMWGTHYVVVESRPASGSITFVDPSLGRLRAPVELLERYWRDVIVAFGDGKFSIDDVCARPATAP